MKKEMVGGVPGNVLGMMADLALKLQNGVLTPQQLGSFLKKEDPFDSDSDISALLVEWEEVYRDLFGMTCDFSSLVIPPKRKGFDRLIVVAKGMTPQKLYDKCKELFLSWKWTDEELDKVVESVRSAKDGAYAVWVRDRVEADEEFKNVSANDAKTRNINGITLEERLVYELKYFREAGKHLDIKNWTLCTGSRYSDGDVLGVDFDPDCGEMHVNRGDPGDAGDDLRLREAVSA